MRITRFTILLTIFVVVLGSENGFAEPAKSDTREIISFRLRSSNTAGPPGRIRRSKSMGLSISESKRSARMHMLERPVTSREFSQEAMTTVAPARRSKSTGQISSISSNPSASKTSTEEGIVT